MWPRVSAGARVWAGPRVTITAAMACIVSDVALLKAVATFLLCTRCCVLPQHGSARLCLSAMNMQLQITLILYISSFSLSRKAGAGLERERSGDGETIETIETIESERD